jgi:hypothetical protein
MSVLTYYRVKCDQCGIKSGGRLASPEGAKESARSEGWLCGIYNASGGNYDYCPACREDKPGYAPKPCEYDPHGDLTPGTGTGYG